MNNVYFISLSIWRERRGHSMTNWKILRWVVLLASCIFITIGLYYMLNVYHNPSSVGRDPDDDFDTYFRKCLAGGYQVLAST